MLSGEIPTAKLDAAVASQGRHRVLFAEHENRALLVFTEPVAVRSRFTVHRITPATARIYTTPVVPIAITRWTYMG